MNIEYSKIGDCVFVTDQDGNVQKRDNIDNLENVLTLENEKEKSDERILEEKDNQKKYKRYRNIMLGVGLSQLIYPATTLATGHGDNVSPFLTGALIITTGFSSLVVHGLVKTFDKKVNRINLYKKAIDKEIKYVLNKSKKINNTDNVRGSLKDKKSKYALTYDKYDLMHTAIIEDYKQNGKVMCPLFNDSERRIFTTMAYEELENNNKSKVKVKEI